MQSPHKSFRAAHPPAQASHLVAHLRHGSIARRRSVSRSRSSVAPSLLLPGNGVSPSRSRSSRSLAASSATTSNSSEPASRKRCCARYTRFYHQSGMILNRNQKEREAPSTSVSECSNQASSLRSRSRTAVSPGAEEISRSRQAGASVSFVDGSCNSGT